MAYVVIRRVIVAKFPSPRQFEIVLQTAFNRSATVHRRGVIAATKVPAERFQTHATRRSAQMNCHRSGLTQLAAAAMAQQRRRFQAVKFRDQRCHSFWSGPMPDALWTINIVALVPNQSPVVLPRREFISNSNSAPRHSDAVSFELSANIRTAFCEIAMPRVSANRLRIASRTATLGGDRWTVNPPLNRLAAPAAGL